MASRDLGLLLGLAWLVYTDGLHQRFAAAGFGDIREPDGVMFRLLHHRQGMTITEIALALEMTKQGASKLVIGLEQRGYVVRQRVPQDQRERLVQLTERGQAVRELGIALAQESEHQLVERAGQAAVDGLRQTLTTLIENDHTNASPLVRLGIHIDQPR